MNKRILWRTVNAGFLVCALLSAFGSFLGIPFPGLWHLLTAFCPLLLLGALGSLRGRGRLLLLTAVLFVLAGAGMAAGGKNTLAFWQSYLWWLSGRQYNPEWTTGYELVQTVFLVLLCYFAQTVMEKDSRFQIGGTGAVLLTLVCFLFSNTEISRPGAAFLISYAAVLFVQWSEAHWKKKRIREGVHRYMLWITPFLGLYFVLMLLPPVPEEPYDWQFVRSIYGQLRESFLKFSSDFLSGGGDDYDLTLGGFSERGRLGGRSGESRREIMAVESMARPVSNLYLTGKVYDTFDGRQWQQSGRDESFGRYMDTAQTLCAVKDYDAEYQTDYLARLDLRISYRDFRSEFLFAPLKTLDIEMDNENIDFGELAGSFYFDKRRGYGTEYKVSFYQMNTGQSAFSRFLDEASHRGEGPPKELLRELWKISGRQAAEEEIALYQQEISERYQEKVILGGDVERYLEAVTEGAGSDVEKLKAVEAELSSFSYSLNPGKLPDTVSSAGEFLDYFLLESREGYCSYFATAFVLLARAEGFPARYVQGFCVPMEDKGETLVYSDMAHAWPEVYFENIGWIPFEPTPGYGKMRYTSWKMRGNRENTARMEDPAAVHSAQAEAGAEQPAKEEIPEMTEESDKGAGVRRFWKPLGIVTLWFFAAVLVLLALNYLAARARYRRMSPDLRLRAEVARNLRILAFLGIARRPEETLEEFRSRTELLPEERRELRFLCSYEDFLYGEKAADQDMLEEAMGQRAELLGLLKRRKPWVYVLYRILYL